MNAVPSQILVSLAASNRFPVEAFEELYAGIALACQHYHVDLIGGDTTSSNAGTCNEYYCNRPTGRTENC